MTTVADSLDGFLLYGAALIVVERAQFEAPSADSGQDKTLPLLWKIWGRDMASGLLWLTSVATAGLGY